jgi:hypothetical protein
MQPGHSATGPGHCIFSVLQLDDVTCTVGALPPYWKPQAIGKACLLQREQSQRCGTVMAGAGAMGEQQLRKPLGA